MRIEYVSIVQITVRQSFRSKYENNWFFFVENINNRLRSNWSLSLLSAIADSFSIEDNSIAIAKM